MGTSSRLTLALFKPDLTANLEKVQKILNIIQENGFHILRSKTVLWRTKDAEEFYQEHRGKSFFDRVVGFMSSGYIKAYVLEREDAIREWRKLLGPTHPPRARLLMPNSLRATYGSTDTRNAFHGSDNWSNAKREIKFFFPEFDYEEYMKEMPRNPI
jgi:nucleoside-diphosphate kinase